MLGPSDTPAMVITPSCEATITIGMLTSAAVVTMETITRSAARLDQLAPQARRSIRG